MSGREAVLGEVRGAGIGSTAARSWSVVGFVRRAVAGWVRLVAALGPSVSDK